MQYGPTSVRDVAPALNTSTYEKCQPAFLHHNKWGEPEAWKICSHKAITEYSLIYILSKNYGSSDKSCRRDHVFVTDNDNFFTIIGGRKFSEDVESELQALLKNSYNHFNRISLEEDWREPYWCFKKSKNKGND